MYKTVILNSLSPENPDFKIVMQWLDFDELLKLYSYADKIPKPGLYKVLAGTYRDEVVRVTEYLFQFDFDCRKVRHNFRWFTLRGIIDSKRIEQEFVPWSLELTTPGYAQKGGNKNYLP